MNDSDPDALTRQLADHYSGTPWRPRYLIANGGQVSSLTRGWIEAPGGGVIPVDAQGKPIKLQTKYWRAEWENDRGDVIRYTLKNTTVLGKPGVHVSVYGSYLPAQLAAIQRQWLNR